MPRKIEVLSIVETGLQRVRLPSLMRPSVPNDDPNEELVIWGVQYYSYAVVAHLRTVLSGLVLIVEAENIPTAFMVCRHIFEWAAHTCYMSRNMKTYVQRRDWRRAWHLNSLAMQGNRWVKDHGPKYLPECVSNDTPDPLSVPNIVNCLEEDRRQGHRNPDAKDTYGLLSEHSHPNAACFMPYCEYVGNEVRFVPSSPDTSLLGVERPLIELMMFLDALLELGREKVVRAQVLAILNELAALAGTLRSAEQS
jgi:hypothetical protein